MSRFFSAMFCILLLSGVVFSDDLTAVTKDGKRVILHDDGSWSYAEEKTAAGDEYNIRKVKWGMTKEEVMASEALDWETGSIDANTDYVMARIDFLGEKAVLVNYINLGQLYMVKYIITEEHSNQTEYWRIYKSFFSRFSEKYGAPLPDRNGEPIWLSSMYKNDPSNWGTAISIGGMYAFAVWETADSSIALLINGDNYKIMLAVAFEDKDFEVIKPEEIEEF